MHVKAYNLKAPSCWWSRPPWRACGKKCMIPHEDLASLAKASFEEFPQIILGLVKGMLSGPSKNQFSTLYTPSDLQKLHKPSASLRELAEQCNQLAKDTDDFMCAYASELPFHIKMQLQSEVQIHVVRSLQAFARVTCMHTHIHIRIYKQKSKLTIRHASVTLSFQNHQRV